MTLELFWALIGAAITLALAGGAWCAVYLPPIVRARRLNRRAVTAAPGAQAAPEALAYARSVDRIDVRNITATGLKTSIDRYTFELEFWWTDTDGTAHHHGPQTYTWPNDLADVPGRIVKQWGVELVTQAVRWRLGIEPVPEP